MAAARAAFWQHPLPRLLWSALGIAAGMSLVVRLVAPPHAPFWLASLGGSALFLFGLTQMPAAQPRALIGGHLGGALIGVICFQLWGGAPWVYVLAVSLTLLFMLGARATHPPAAANPIVMIANGAPFPALWELVLPGTLLLAATAWLWSRLYPDQPPYPGQWLAPSPPQALEFVWQSLRAPD